MIKSCLSLCIISMIEMGEVMVHNFSTLSPLCSVRWACARRELLSCCMMTPGSAGSLLALEVRLWAGCTSTKTRVTTPSEWWAENCRPISRYTVINVNQNFRSSYYCYEVLYVGWSRNGVDGNGSWYRVYLNAKNSCCSCWGSEKMYSIYCNVY